MKSVKPSGYILPSYDILVRTKQTYRTSIQKTMLSMPSVLKWRAKYGEVTFRGIKCSDLGLTSWQIPVSKTQANTRWIQTSANQKVIAIFKVTPLSLTPTVSNLAINISGAVVWDNEINTLYSILPIIKRLKKIEEEDSGWVKAYFGGIDEVRMEGYFTESIIIDDGHPFTIDITTKCDPQGPEELVLSGFVIEQPELEDTETN